MAGWVDVIPGCFTVELELDSFDSLETWKKKASIFSNKNLTSTVLVLNRRYFQR